jgi:hypothetical protein
MNTEKIEKMSGHWLLAKLGKKVLRPGGVTLTQKMLSMLNITSNDDVVVCSRPWFYSSNVNK